MESSGEEWGIHRCDYHSNPAPRLADAGWTLPTEDVGLVILLAISLSRPRTTTMFIGEYIHAIDEKGRLALPSKFRAKLAEGVVVTRGVDSCLFLYTQEEWQKLAEKLAALPITQRNTRAFARLMLAGAMDLGVDKQGRVVLPEYLRKYAKLKKQVVVAGLYGHLELWDEALWSKEKERLEGSSDEIAEQLSELGLV